MVGLFFSQVFLLALAGVIGFTVGWQLRQVSYAILRRGIERDLSGLMRRLGEAQVRRARRA